MKKLFLIFAILTAFFLSANPAHASEMQDCLDELSFADIRISAVSADMSFFLGMAQEKPEGLAEAARKAVKDLDEIRNELVNLDAPPELNEVRNICIEAVSLLRGIYEGSEAKAPEELAREFANLNELHTKTQKTVSDAFEKYGSKTELPEDFDPLKEEVKLLEDPGDKLLYSEAIELVREGKTKEAFEKFAALREKHKDKLFEHCALLRMSDCVFMKGDYIDGVPAGERPAILDQGLEFLASILASGRYSPVLSEAFHKWRTMTQANEYGMSNWAEIPNKGYNEKRREIIRTLKKYFAGHPEDRWARIQIEMLLQIPNIQRGGPAGNDNLLHWALLYTRPSPERYNESGGPDLEPSEPFENGPEEETSPSPEPEQSNPPPAQ